MSSLLARLAGIGHPERRGEPLRLRRAWPRGDDRLLLEYAADGGATIAGQWHADRRRGEAIARATPGGTWLPDPGVVLQPDGADRRLPAIARLAAEPGASLVVHRPERRAVVRRPGPTYAKIVRPERAAAVLAVDRVARDTGAVLLPDLRDTDLGAGVLEWAELPGRALHDLLLDTTVPVPDLVRAGTATGRAVRALHDAAPPVGVAPHHRPEAEIDTAARWVRPAAAFGIAPAGVDRTLREAASLLAAAPTSPVLVHRDLHEKQVLIDGDRAGLLDVDTLAVGEAAVDLANLLVHLDLRVLLGLPPERSQAVAEAFLVAYQPTREDMDRVAAYAASTRVRLACVYAFRPAEMVGAARLLAPSPGPETREPHLRRTPPAVPHRPRPRIAFVLGKPPKPSSVVAALLGLLRSDSLDVGVHLPHEHPGPAPAWLLDVDLVVQRGLDSEALEALAPVEEAGIRCCNPIASTGALADRIRLSRRLAGAGVLVPRTEPAATWAEAQAAAEDRPIVVKARDGRRGRGTQVLIATDGHLPATAPFDGPYIVQDHVPGDGNDRKLYVAGDYVRGLLKPALPRPGHRENGTPFQPTCALTQVGCATSGALGLDIFGVDIVVGAAGAHVVDVNPFPGFRGVAGGAQLIAAHLSRMTLSGRR